MTAEIIPTVFVKEGEDFMSRFNKIIGISNQVQIDFMDGKFVKHKSASIDEIPNLKSYNLIFEAHLMVSNPEEWIEKLSKKGFSNVIFHFESVREIQEIKYIAGVIRRWHMNPIIALNPDTNVEEVFPVLDVINHVLLMGVNPGKEGQTFIADTIKKIKLLKNYKGAIRVQVDGGVNLENIKEIADSGCDYINSGSLIFNSENSKSMLLKLQTAVDISEDDGWD